MAAKSSDYVDVTLHTSQLELLVAVLSNPMPECDTIDPRVKGLIVAFQSALDDSKALRSKVDERIELLRKAGL